jgi:large subunit ribosomal protein L17
MRHQVKRSYLRRNSAHRTALLRNLATSVIERERVRTTLAKARNVRPLVEKMITLGKKGTLAARRSALAFLTKEAAVTKLFAEIAPRFQVRAGGYTRIVKLDRRSGDGAAMAYIELVGSEFKKKARKKKKEKPAAK